MTVARFWREQKNRYNIIGTKCGNCDRIYFPPKDICRDCHRKSIGKMEPVKLKGGGKIISYTIIHEAPDSFKNQVPYAMALIELDEGTKITAQIVDLPMELEDGAYKNVEASADEKNEHMIKNDLAIGNRVRCVFRKIREDGKSGRIQYGYKFKLAKE